MPVGMHVPSIVHQWSSLVRLVTEPQVSTVPTRRNAGPQWALTGTRTPEQETKATQRWSGASLSASTRTRRPESGPGGGPAAHWHPGRHRARLRRLPVARVRLGLVQGCRLWGSTAKMQGPEKTAAALATAPSGSLPAQCLPVTVTASSESTGSGILQVAVD
jgi:hypothetical protein